MVEQVNLRLSRTPMLHDQNAGCKRLPPQRPAARICSAIAPAFAVRSWDVESSAGASTTAGRRPPAPQAGGVAGLGAKKWRSGHIVVTGIELHLEDTR